MGQMIARCEVNASHNKNMKKIRAMKEIIDPIEDTTFHVVMESG